MNKIANVDTFINYEEMIQVILSSFEDLIIQADLVLSDQNWIEFKTSVQEHALLVGLTQEMENQLTFISNNKNEYLTSLRAVKSIFSNLKGSITQNYQVGAFFTFFELIKSQKEQSKQRLREFNNRKILTLRKKDNLEKKINRVYGQLAYIWETNNWAIKERPLHVSFNFESVDFDINEN